MKKLFLCISAAFFLSYGAFAQNDYALFIENDKKILYTDRFNLPESATIIEALSILPELLSRSNESILTNYNVKIDGFSLGASYEGTLSQIRLGQVQKIEVSESPIDSYNSNGVGGSINIILKPLDDGFSGEAALSAYSLFEVKPMVNLGYRKNVFTVRGIAEFDHYRPHDLNSYTQGYVDGKEVPYSTTDSTDRKYTSETVRILMEYRPTERDEFKLRLSEHYAWDDKNQFTDTKQGDVSTKADKLFNGTKLSIDANTRFKHTFTSGSKFLLEATYSYTPAENNTRFSDHRTIGTDNLKNSISGKLEYEHHFRTARPDNFTRLFLGANLNNTTTEKYYGLRYDSSPDQEVNINSVIHTWFISPYAKIDVKAGNWRLKAEAEYQNFNYYVRGGTDNKKYDTRRGDLTGKIMAGWQINSNNHLQLIFDRKLQRPSGSMLYPYLTFNPDYNRYEYGNTDLIPMTINELSLNYITNFTRGVHSFVFNGKVSYMNVNDLLTPSQFTDQTTYTKYLNKGVNNIISGQVTAIYRISSLFNLSLTGNVYNNHKNVDETVDDYTYCNLSVFPSFTFRRNWGVSSRLTYYSPVTTRDSEIGAATTLSLTVSKSWNRFSAYIFGIVPLNGRSVDTKQEKGMDKKKSYWYLHPYAGITLNYKF